MSDTVASLRRKISSAGDLQSVVRAMKALAAPSIGPYEHSVRALADYYRTMELGLGACVRDSEPAALMGEGSGQTDADAVGVVVFGSDQGLVGQFNEVVADYVDRRAHFQLTQRNSFPSTAATLNYETQTSRYRRGRRRWCQRCGPGSATV